jgi:hypothetical protein
MKGKKQSKGMLTPYMDLALKHVNEEGYLTLATIQRKLKCTFMKSIEIAIALHEKGLVKSNIKLLKIEQL